MKQFYPFSSTEYVTDPSDLELIGSRGKRVMELASIGTPISPGVVVVSEAVNQISNNELNLREALREPIDKMESVFKKKFDDPKNPLLIKVVESPMLNMVNTFSTIHNIGLVDHSVDGFAAFVGEEFGYHEYINLLQNICELEQLTDPAPDRKKALTAFGRALKKVKDRAGLEKVVGEHGDVLPAKIYKSSWEQLLYVVKLFHALFQTNQNSSDSALLIQVMVFGNFGESSGFGSFFTHDIITGDNVISGDYFENAFDATSKRGKPIDKVNPELKGELERIAKEMEKQFKEIRRIRFTVESGNLWVIDQTPVANKSTQAEIKTLLDLHKDGVIDEEYVINAVKPGRLSEMLHPALDPSSVGSLQTATGGIAGAVGAAIGRIYFSTGELMKAYRTAQQKGDDTDCLLVMPSTFAEDVKAIEVARGVLTAEGGYASHAPVVARSLGKVAMVYPKIEFRKSTIKIGSKVLKEGDYITLNVPYYEKPAIYFGRGSLTKPSPEGSGLLELLDIIQHKIGDFDVHANADQPKDAELAKRFLAKGIGLCRTEHMFFAEDRIQKFRTMVIADSREDRQKVLDDLIDMQIDDFYHLFKIMEGYPVTIRLLDAPLHEFLPHAEDSMKEFHTSLKSWYPKLTLEELKARCELLDEFNPMLGHRGIRIAISYPEIYNMQVRAIFEAAYRLKSEGIDVHPEIMVPLVMNSTEIKTIRNGKRIEGKSIVGIKDIENEVKAKYECDPVEYKVGTMIELPAAALQAGKIARYADFFSFGTNDLTQTTNGLSRDDFNNFFTDYNEFDLLEENPFKVLGEQVKEMIAIAAERGTITRPGLKMGICGEHGAEPANIPFAYENGMTYVSCSPFGIPIAKLAIAQMNLREGYPT